MKEIFSHFIPKRTDTPQVLRRRQAYASWFVDTFPQTEFEGDEYIMWFLLEYSVDLGVPLKERYLDTFMDSELKELLAKTGTRIPGTEMLSFDNISQLETALQMTRSHMKQEYFAMTMSDLDIDEFLASADAFMSEQLKDRVINLYSKGFTMLNSVQEYGLMGARDTLEFTQTEAEKIAEIYDRERLEELDTDGAGEEDDNEGFEFVYDFGLPTIDADCGGAYTTQLFGFDSAPGQGKTRFSLGVSAYRAYVVYKKNVVYFSLEQSEAEIKAMLVARHMFTLFQVQVSDQMILKRKEKPLTKDINDKYEAAKIDLFESGRYGKLHIICSELYINNFINKMRVADSLHGPFDVIIIDYMALIDQKQEKGYRFVDDFKVTAKAYKLFKRYLRRTKKTGLAINQFNAEGTRAAREDKEVGPTGTAGGMEAHRSVDYMLSMTASEEMITQRKRRLASTKKRGTEGFGSVIVDVRLGFCYYYQATANIL